MSDLQAADPTKDNQQAAEEAAKGESLLTADVKGTTSSTQGAASELPHAWMNGLTTEQKADADLIKSLSKFERGIPDIVKSYAELEKKAGQAIVVPNEKATEEEKAAYRKAIGVPEKPEDYKLEPATLPEGLTVDEAMQKQFLQIVHAAGLNPNQVNAINQWYMKTIGEQIVDAQKVVKTTRAEAEAAITKKYGLDRDAAKGYMERAFARYATPSLAEKYIKTGLDNDPETIEMFINIGRDMGDHVFVDGSRGEHLESGVVGQRTDEQIAATMYPPEEGQ